MPMIQDVEHTYKRFGIYIDQLREVMTKYGIQGNSWREYLKFTSVLKSNPAARTEIGALLRVIVALDGGKGTMGTIGMVVALSIGGVGVAAMGSAFGIPAAVLTLLGTAGGALLGNELDGTGTTAKLLSYAGVPSAMLHLGRKVSGLLEDSPIGAVREETIGRDSKGDSPEPTMHKEEEFEDPLYEMKEVLVSLKTEIASFSQYQEAQSNILESQGVELKGIAASIERIHAQHSQDQGKLFLKLGRVFEQTSKIESTAEANGNSIRSLQEQADASNAYVTRKGEESAAEISNLERRVSHIFTALVVVIAFGIAGVVLSLLILRHS